MENFEFLDAADRVGRYGGRYIPRKIAQPSYAGPVVGAVCVFVAVILGGAYLAYNSLSTDSPVIFSPRDATVVYARKMAKECVLKSLIHPLDASFPAVPEVGSEGDGLYRIESVVKAKNGFGAELTYRWKVVLSSRQESTQDTRVNQWTVVSCEIFDR